MKHTSLFIRVWVITLSSLLICSCIAGSEIDSSKQPPQGQPNNPDNEENDEESPIQIPDNPEIPDGDMTIARWEGLWADDMADDKVGDNSDFYHELNNFGTQVFVTYNNDVATVECTNKSIKCYIDGAHVALDMTAVSGVEVIAMGKSADGSLKLYSDNKYKLTLNGLDLTSQRGPAINSQSKKRVYVHLGEDTTNRLTDSPNYIDDHYTIAGAVNEDRKGALFAEGNIILSGHGALVVAGKQKHAIVTDGCYYQRSGVTVVVTESLKNGIHVKGDSDDNTGAVFEGGAIVVDIASTAGKAVKCDMDIVVNGGKFDLKTSGNATYDSEEQDTSAASCLKSNTNIYINGGVFNLSSSGTGGKGISADGNLEVNSGTVSITTTGGQYRYSNSLTSSPKGIRADGDITINGGSLNISVTGVSEGSEGMESKAILTFNGGDAIIKAYDDAINAGKAINMNGGKVFAQATNNDGIDSNGTLTLNGGVFIGIGSREPEGGIDVDNSTLFVINGGVAIGLGGTMMGTPSTASKQYSVVYGGVAASMGDKISVLDAANTPILTFELPVTASNSALFFSTPEITNGATYSIMLGGTLSDYSDTWQGYYLGGIWSGGTSLVDFTPTSVVTTIGNVGGGPGGGGPGGPGGGGGRPDRPW